MRKLVFLDNPEDAHIIGKEDMCALTEVGEPVVRRSFLNNADPGDPLRYCFFPDTTNEHYAVDLGAKGDGYTPEVVLNDKNHFVLVFHRTEQEYDDYCSKY